MVIFMKTRMKIWLLAMCIALAPAMSTTAIAVENKAQESVLTSITNRVKDYLSNLSVPGVAKDLTTSYVIMMLTIVAHEMAHAIAAKLLYGVPSDVCVGMSKKIEIPRGTDDTSTLSFVGFAPMGQSKARWNKDTKRTPIKDAIRSIAGPLVGALANYLALKLLISNTDKNSYFLSKLMSIGGIVGHAAQLIPYSVPVYGTGSDGSHAWKAIMQYLKENHTNAPAAT
jgi:hypothetical protein